MCVCLCVCVCVCVWEGGGGESTCDIVYIGWMNRCAHSTTSADLPIQVRVLSTVGWHLEFCSLVFFGWYIQAKHLYVVQNFAGMDKTICFDIPSHIHLCNPRPKTKGLDGTTKEGRQVQFFRQPSISLDGQQQGQQ